MKESIFKAYDVRGVYPNEINEEAAYRIGLAFAHFTGAKKILVGEDARASTPQLKQSLIKGLTASGSDVFLAGALTTPLFYFAVANNQEYDAGIMITASHNPGKYNGFKMIRGDAMPIGAGSGMEEIKNLVLKNELKTKNTGQIKKVDIKGEYLNKLFNLVAIKNIKPLHIAIDAGNGMASATLNLLLEKLPQLKVEKLFFNIDMSFPNHEANPLKEETLVDLKSLVKSSACDIGIAYDGDADRIGFVDENGEFIRADFIFSLILPELLKNRPGAPVLYDLRCSKIVPEIIKQLGGKPKMTRVGHAFIKKDLKKMRAVAAGELSSHFYFKDFFNVESADLVMLYVLKLLSDAGKNISELVLPLKKYSQSGEINFEVSDKQAKINKLKEKYSPLAIDLNELDGIRLEFEEGANFWWFNVRASNTEPLLRLNVEASNQNILEEKIKELSQFIQN